MVCPASKKHRSAILCTVIGAFILCMIVSGRAMAACPGDINPPGGNGVVNVDDLLKVINTWGACPAPPVYCTADISPPGGNGAVGVDDLLKVINTWGACAAGTDDDSCETPTLIAVGQTLNGNLQNATQDVPPTCSSIPPGFGRWYKVIGNGNSLTATTCGSTADLWDCRINVYCGPDCASLYCVIAANVDSCAYFHESTSWCSAANQPYLILVHTDTGGGPYQITVNNGLPCNNPVACHP